MSATAIAALTGVDIFNTDIARPWVNGRLNLAKKGQGIAGVEIRRTGKRFECQEKTLVQKPWINVQDT
jgi:hypothetical protein